MAPSPPMTVLCHLLLLACFLFPLASVTVAQQKPKALVLTVTRDVATLQYLTTVDQRTPLVPLKLVVDLGGQFMWVDCDDPRYVSSSYTPARCRSARCALIGGTSCGNCGSPARPGCNNDTCGVFPGNPFKNLFTGGEVASDTVALTSIGGAGLEATVPQFLFSCAPAFLLDGLAAGAKGMAGLGRSRAALPTQLAAAFSLHRRFAICLSSNTDGFVYFGGNVLDVFTGSVSSLTYTPLLTNPVSDVVASVEGQPSYQYFVGVSSVKVGDKAVPLNSTLLSIGRDGVGGTKISTVVPYTVLETSIHRAVTDAFVAEATARGISTVPAVAPFGACFDGKTMGFGREGPEVPPVDLVFQSESAYWRMYGVDSMVRVGDINSDLWCLAMVDGGSNPRTSIVIGGHQLKDNLLEFDLATSRLGFTSSLLQKRTTCDIRSVFA